MTVERQPDIEAVAERLGLPADDPLIQADLRQLAGSRADDTAPADTPPGWYPIAGEKGRRRYWDGQAWTDHWERRSTWSTAATVGMGFALLVPFVGFLMGLALVAGRDPHGHWVVLASIGSGIAGLLLVASTL